MGFFDRMYGSGSLVGVVHSLRMDVMQSFVKKSCEVDLIPKF